MTSPTGLLLVNLGTPDSPRPWDVFRYLNEFLTDPRVIDLPWLRRQLLVRGIIVPLRFRQSAKLYQKLWTEEGSPLLVHGKSVKNLLQASLGNDFKVALAMRYQNPSISAGLEELRKANVKEIVILPLFPQYASATTGSIHQKVMEHVRNWTVIPKMTFIQSYHDHPALIDAFCEKSRSHQLDSYDQIIFSFHGLPERQILQADPRQTCLQPGCCERKRRDHRACYRQQCVETADAIAKQLQISPERYTICFQSRLGKDPWIQPYTSDILQQCAKEGKKRLLVFCPSFVCDCLETTSEISDEYGHLFKQSGGAALDLVEGLNDHPAWIKTLRTLVLEQG